MKKFNLSTNIEYNNINNLDYIVTPNAVNVAGGIIDGYKSGVHSYNIIGTYGTGKSSFILAFEHDIALKKEQKPFFFNPENLIGEGSFEILNIVGDYMELSTMLAKSLKVEGSGNSIIDELDSYYKHLEKEGKTLIIVIDEFGKILEHAAKNNPERELYFLQKFAEYVNHTDHNILFLTTLHQNFSSYARELSDSEIKEWDKVKGRFKELVFVEPVEQLLYLASVRNNQKIENYVVEENFRELFLLAKKTAFLSDSFSYNIARGLYPLDPFAAFVITRAIQEYGQNERSLFSFLNAGGKRSFKEFVPNEKLTYNLEEVYNYIQSNFYSYLTDVNSESMQWSAIRIAAERVEGQTWITPEEMINALKLIKTIGLLNIFGTAAFKMNLRAMKQYAKFALDIHDAGEIIRKLETFKIIRYAQYKERFILFEGTDVDIEAEVAKASLIVSRPVNYIDRLCKLYTNKMIAVKSSYYKNGTPRYFEYIVTNKPLSKEPKEDVDGFINLIFSHEDNALEEIKKHSKEEKYPILYAYFNKTDEIVDSLHNIDKYQYIINRVLLDKADHVAQSELNKMIEFEQIKLNSLIYESLYSFAGGVSWIYSGKEKTIRNHRDLNIILGQICDEIYSKTPILHNELFNKHKLTGAISTAKKKFIKAMLNNSDVEDLGFDNKKFPPEKTIYYTLLKNTGLHSSLGFSETPSDSIRTLWDACEEFLKSTSSKPRKISLLIKMLSEAPYKLKQGFIDFWIPTYFIIKRNDYSLYNKNGMYIPRLTEEFFELLAKNSGDFLVKALDVSGVKVDFFNKYRHFINLGSDEITGDSLLETIRPFFLFYNSLNAYTKHTNKFNHKETVRFRNILQKAKDPEKTFFEDIPEALGYSQEDFEDENKIKEYCYLVERSIRELRSCYTDLIDRIEQKIIEELALDSFDYTEYIVEIRDRMSYVKEYLLTDRQREFYTHVMTTYESREEWYQSICYTALDQPLTNLKDEQEDILINNLITLFSVCRKYIDISKFTQENKSDQIYSFDLVSNKGDNFKSMTYSLPDNLQKESDELKSRIKELLTGNTNLNVCTVIRTLKELINNEN